jgi:hypothetical protein
MPTKQGQNRTKQVTKAWEIGKIMWSHFRAVSPVRAKSTADILLTGQDIDIKPIYFSGFKYTVLADALFLSKCRTEEGP